MRLVTQDIAGIGRPRAERISIIDDHQQIIRVGRQDGLHPLDAGRSGGKTVTAGDDFLALLRQSSLVLRGQDGQRRLNHRLRQRIRRQNLVQKLGHITAGNGHAAAKPRRRMRFRQGSQHHKIGKAFQSGRHAVGAGIIDIGLVDHYQRTSGKSITQASYRFAVHQIRGRVIRRTDENHLRGHINGRHDAINIKGKPIGQRHLAGLDALKHG